MTFPHEVACTYIENWPQRIADMSVESKSIKLSYNDACVLGTFSTEFIRSTGYTSAGYFSDELLEGLRDSLKDMPGGIMPRIGDCSWKYSTIINLPAKNINVVLKVISQDDPRIGRALSWRLATGDEIYLHLRKWYDIPPWSEFRIFIKNRKIAGVSQYFYRTFYNDIPDNSRAIKSSIADFSRELIDSLHMDTVVADVFVEKAKDGRLKTTLIELNPFSRRTDPCLYTWNNGGDFDGGFRYCKVGDASIGNVDQRSYKVDDDPWRLPLTGYGES